MAAMNTTVDPLAGKLPPRDLLIDTDVLQGAYADGTPDPGDPAQRVRFGTSGHRGSALRGSFNDRHVAAIVQAICSYRRSQGIDGPLFLGRDTHALSEPAFATAVEVLAGNGVELRIPGDARFTPTPAVSLAILDYRPGRGNGMADGIVVTPSHNPPDSGGIKYNPPTGGPASAAVAGWIEREANRLLAAGSAGIRRVPLRRALGSSSTRYFDYLGHYLAALPEVVDLAAIAASGIRLGVDPLGGAGVEYWGAIGERHGLALDVVSEEVDPTFQFVAVDWDGQIRMDPSSPYAMQGLIGLRERYDLAGACDPDHDRHGIVTPALGLLPANDYLATMASYLCRYRPDWPVTASLGRTAVTSLMLDRVAARHGRGLYEVPVGFKWFTEPLLAGALAFAGEESAGASLARFDGTAWTTDKDGIVAVLLAAEMTARTGRDPGEQYAMLAAALGRPVYRRVDVPATAAGKARLARLSRADLAVDSVGDDPVESVADRAAGNGEPLGGLRVTTRNGWFAVRPSGTEDLYKLYAESMLGRDHLERLLGDAQDVVAEALAEGAR